MIVLQALRLAGPGAAARTLLATLLGVLCLTTLETSPADAKQCIWNKAGFVLRVEWYDPSMITYEQTTKAPLLRPGAEPAQTDVYPLAQGRCNDRPQNLIAVMGVDGADWIKKGLQIGAGAVAAVTGAVACVGTAGVACPAAAAGGSSLVTLAGELIPNPKELGTVKGVFTIENPGNEYWLDVWGTAFDPQTGRGGRI